VTSLARRHPGLSCFIIAVLATAGCARSDRPIRIGLAGPLSDPVGSPMKLSAELAVTEINASGGIGGRRLELVERDDHGDPDSAVAVATELYDAGVVAVVGHVYSGTTLASAGVYNGGRDPVVQISPSSSSPEVTQAGDYTFRICPSDLAHGAALAHWARERLNLQRGAVLYLNDEYGRGIRETFDQEFTRLRGEVIENDPYLGARPDLGPYLDRLARRRNLQFVLVAGNRSEAEAALRAARARGITVPFLGGDGLEGIEEAGTLAEGTYVSAAYLPSWGSAANRKFVEAYQHHNATAGLPNQPAAGTYDALYLLRSVIARTGTSRRKIRDGVAAIGLTLPPFEGVTGTIAFDLNGDVPNQQVVIGVVRQGAVVPAEGQ
jgi:branched-chain amino acid transport system substrate-binding protein